ncbi:MAG: alpha-1,4-glucan--maltose-1-phosphate maltosyltransferase [Chitinophagales bacterium]|nr:alpha-1,4-glucan--maltose-1-phosphate maltosyltransferase [Chitinophagales bacterium]MDW8393905.1 alpha-1,4-glucan--maltose-1-phosphate maltosyltransferase [Chitinophagales bacterium]
MKPTDQPNGRNRVVIDQIQPVIEGGRYPVRRTTGEWVEASADVFADGHDVVQCRLLYRHHSERRWHSVPMEPVYGHTFRGSFRIQREGLWQFKIAGWVDHPLSWQHQLKRRHQARERLESELLMGAQFLRNVLTRCRAEEQEAVQQLVDLFTDSDRYEQAVQAALNGAAQHWFLAYPADELCTESAVVRIMAERLRARFSTWYELFPRSAASKPGHHGTFSDVQRLLPRLQEMGIDVLYLPPIHPIGLTNRKGKNNSLRARKGEPGVPWAIGNKEGGHKAIHPQLGTLQDFRALLKAAAEQGIEIALDYALQCSPDHPYVKQHPSWFRWRPDGSVQYAENPPKKYQDVIPFNFETEDWKNLWDELKSILEFWIQEGVKIFRVDNPHTKPMGFWEWVIAKIHEEHPEVIFLSEAFTAPKMMYHLAKIGFTQSYTYFTWRQTKAELMDYMEELTKSEVREFFRPNFWPNTPDILPFHLQSGTESVFITRLFLAATLSANYGFYGPVYELMVHEALPGREEYLNSEKYELRHWDWDRDTRLKMLIAIINRARREHEALQFTNNIEFLNIQNEHLLAYLKYDPAGSAHLLCVANLHPDHTQSGFVQVPLEKIGRTEEQEFAVRDLLNDARYIWKGRWNYVELNPRILPCHLFRIEDP